ncbi:MAG: DUF423 domain-containing protein [Opitutaceae bacterium]
MANSYTKFKILGGLFALLAVVLGAFGAHGLKVTLLAHGTLDTWKTAVEYQMWHALALLILCSSAMPTSTRALKLCGCCFTVGIVLFSGSLYWLALDGPNWLGPITPLGGLSFLLGWASFLWAQIISSTHSDDELSSKLKD